MKTTNYFHTLILPAEDCPAHESIIPSDEKKKTIATMQYDIISQNPQKYTSDDVIFDIYASRNDLANDENTRAQFFSKGQPCMRTSPLTKRYGWAMYSNHEGKISLVSIPSAHYDTLMDDDTVKKIFAMRTSRK